MSVDYGLYQTLSSSPSPQRQLTKAQHNSLRESLNNLDLETRKACLLLVCEHSRQEGGFEYNDSGPQTLPYGITIKENGDIEMNLNNLPLKLKYILLKFCDIASKAKAE